MMVRDTRGDSISAMTTTSESRPDATKLGKKDLVQSTFDDLLAYRESVFRICLGFARDYPEAEDLAQDVYLRAYRNLGALKDPAVTKEWLFRIARNACLDRNKKARVREQLLRRWAEAPKPGDDPEPEAPDAERLAQLKTSIQRLPKRLRSVFILRTYGHLAYDEIAATLGLAKGTVMSRLSRARARIAETLKEKRP
jgi:RNA polymerase sigma-70 factor (ECF subfamily)